jgi:dTDP-4-amino-4,6-dideoxygalactose transaminase
MIRFKQLPIGDEEKEAAIRVINSGSLSMGKFVGDFEEDFAKFIGAKHAIATNSCTSALFLSLLCENRIRYGWPMAHNEAKVLLPSMTVPVVANAILHTQAGLHFVDNTGWVGSDYQLYPFQVWDSAHLVRPKQYKKYKDPKALVCFSFYPTKNICGAEGGMIATDDDDYSEWLRKARWYGRNSGASNIKNSWEYEIEFVGYKMNMTDMQAAIAHEGLKKFYKLDEQIAKIIDVYNTAFGVKNTSNYLFRLNIPNRDGFIKYMGAKGIECGVHFWPLHWQPAYNNITYDYMAETEAEAMTTISLPLHPFLESFELDYIINYTKDWKTKYGNG